MGRCRVRFPLSPLEGGGALPSEINATSWAWLSTQLGTPSKLLSRQTAPPNQSRRSWVTGMDAGTPDTARTGAERYCWRCRRRAGAPAPPAACAKPHWGVIQFTGVRLIAARVPWCRALPTWSGMVSLDHLRATSERCRGA